MRLLPFAISVAGALAAGGPYPASARQTLPAWDNVVAYEILTDRFANGDADNDNAYGRGLDEAGQRLDAGPYDFHGGDLQGVADAIRSGHFSDVGVTAIRVSPPFEQIHGAVTFQGNRMFAFAGGWPLDFTSIDEGYGGEAALADLVRTAHEAGIRVVLEVNVNVAGPPTETDRLEFGFGLPLNRSAETASADAGAPVSELLALSGADSAGMQPSDSLMQTPAEPPDVSWRAWWGPSWVRADLPGYSPCGDERTTQCQNGWPDFRTEVGEPADIPTFLVRKWGPEKTALERASLQAFFTRTRHARTPRHYLIKWLTDWVARYGIDGFYARDAGAVDVGLWSALRAEADIALADWRDAAGFAPTMPESFWLGTDVDVDSEMASILFDRGFSSMNLEVSASALDPVRIDSLYSVLSDTLSAQPGRGFALSLDPGRSPPDARTMTAFLLSPGTITLPFGLDFDNNGGPPPLNDGGAFSTPEWAEVARFRRRHRAIGAGAHEQISVEPYAFRRTLRSSGVDDNVVVVLGAEGRTRINVSGAFPDDAIVRDALTGSTGFVSFGYVSLTPGPTGTLLLELAEQGEQ